MCGFVAHLYRDKPSNSMLEHNIALAHKYLNQRGPDGLGRWSQETTSAFCDLIHFRLSIIDIDDRSNQPMSFDDTDWILLFNGEIYNYVELRSFLEKKYRARFWTKSDSEVVLRGFELEGIPFISKLSGMFAITLVNKESGKIVAARDHIGMKPLFVSVAPAKVMLGSDPRMLATSVSSSLNTEAVVEFLSLGYLFDDSCMFSGISQVRPGEILEIKDYRIVNRRNYYDIVEELGSSVVENFNENDRCVDVLTNCLDLHCRTDVDFGVMASGGIDTRLCVLGLLEKDQQRLTKAYTVDKPSSRWELEAATELMGSVGLGVTPLSVPEFGLEELAKNIKACTQPVADMSVLFSSRVAAAARSDDCKVLLSGVGGDEVFFGYNRYLSKRRRALFRLIGLLKNIKSAAGPHELQRIISPSYGLATSVLGGFDFDITEYEKQNLLNTVFSKFRALDKRVSRLKSLNKRMMSVDLLSYVPGQLCVISDSILMAHSVEGRLPLLDKELLSFVGSCGDDFLYSNGEAKSGAKRTLRSRGLLSGYESKSGFGFNDFNDPKAWWREKMLTYVKEACPKEFLIDEKSAGPLSNAQLLKVYSITAWLAT